MKVYAFSSATDQELCGFTPDPHGDNLPADKGPWRPLKALDINPGEQPRGGINPDAVITGVEGQGFYLSSDQFTWNEIT